MDFEGLLERIYEAAAVPELWIDVLDRLAEVAGAEGSILFVANPEAARWNVPRCLFSAPIAAAVGDWIEPEVIKLNARERLIAMREPRFLTDLDAFTAEELDSNPWYRDFLRPRGLGWCAGTAIRSVSGESIIFNVERAHRKGPVEPEAVAKLDRFRPHLARAALLSARLGLERARAMADALTAIGLPGAVLNGAGRVLACNALIQDCAPALSIGANDVVWVANPSAKQLFETALAAPLIERNGRVPVHSIPIAGTPETGPYIAHLLPVRGSGLDNFAGANWILFVTFVSSGAAVGVEALETLFDLTTAEARVASRLTAGHSVEAIAKELAVTANTVRAHLKSIFSKTGVRRQAELVSLLAPRLSKVF